MYIHINHTLYICVDFPYVLTHATYMMCIEFSLPLSIVKHALQAVNSKVYFQRVSNTWKYAKALRLSDTTQYYRAESAKGPCNGSSERSVSYVYWTTATDLWRAQGCPEVHLCIVECQYSKLHDNRIRARQYILRVLLYM